MVSRLKFEREIEFNGQNYFVVKKREQRYFTLDNSFDEKCSVFSMIILKPNAINALRIAVVYGKLVPLKNF